MEIPGYQLLDKIGAGGAANVYCACQQSLQRKVAIKLLAPRGGAQAIRDFEREAQLLAALAHPNIVAIYDCGQVNGQCYLVTEYVAGASLRSRMTPGQPWPAARVLPLIDKVARALEHIHKHGILHLDLKPENILTSDDGEVKIADFGLALTRGDFTDQPAGTIDYCAPEQRFGRPVDQRADVFALAALTYELLTGHVPGRVFLPATASNRSVSDAVDPVLRRGLERHAGDRYASVAAFWNELSAALRRRRTRGLVGAGIAVTGMLLVLAWLVFGGVGAPAGRPSQAWVLFNRAETLPWLAGAAGKPLCDADGLAVAAYRWGDAEVKRLSADWLPRPPEPLPVLFLPGPDTLGFFHPLMDHQLGERLARDWPRLQAAAAPKENFVRRGDFGEPAALPVAAADARYWRWIPGLGPGPTDEAAIAPAAQRKGAFALRLTRPKNGAADSDLGFYQYLTRLPGRAGTVVVLRYRIRALGAWRICVSPCMPLTIPAEEKGPVASHLRQHALPLPEPQAGASWYRLDDWIVPGREWRTGIVIWEWPPYCASAAFRHLEIRCRGHGTVWLTGLELFPWEPEASP